MIDYTNEELRIIAKEIGHLIDSCCPIISQETIDAVHSYSDYGEYEMAVEGLLIDIMQMIPFPKSIRINDCVELAQRCHLDKETVFTQDFWGKFTDFATQHGASVQLRKE